MATGPTSLVNVDEMMFEGCRLAHDLKLADDHIDVLEKENKKLKEVIMDLNGECAVFKAERNQADEKVLEQEKEMKLMTEQTQELKAKLQEWEDFEGWRQGRWVLVQEELKKLKSELSALKAQQITGVVEASPTES